MTSLCENIHTINQSTSVSMTSLCENIHKWYSLSTDLLFSQQDGIYIFKFPKRFLEISFRYLTLFLY